MILFKILLWPFSILYGSVMCVRNFLYKKGYRKSFHFDTFTINVGNLSMGGTGKTPQIEYLVRLLGEKFKIATLSRGYGRRSKGFILAEPGVTALEIGDEPMQYFCKFKDKIKVAVGEERALAIPSILLESPATQVILLDDAYQHRAVRPDINILLTDYARLFYEDFLLPLGRLRESRKEARRADIIVVSKCPEFITDLDKKSIDSKIRHYSKPEVLISFSTIKYGAPLPVFNKPFQSFANNIFLITGIANPLPLKTHIATTYHLIGHQAFSDHRAYSENDVRSILKAYNAIELKEKCLLTTEKDMVKLRTEKFESILSEIPIYYLPIEVAFSKEDQFDDFVLKAVNKKYN